jgi:hypothetical protein
VTDAHRHFNEDVVDVNKGLVSAYRRHHQEQKFVRQRALAVGGSSRFLPDRF